jgi:hypothetical protein
MDKNKKAVLETTEEARNLAKAAAAKEGIPLKEWTTKIIIEKVKGDTR